MGAQHRAKGGDNLELPRSDIRLEGAAADVEVVANFVCRRDAENGAYWVAVDQKDAFVALGGLGKVALGHRPVAAGRGRGVEDRREVGIPALGFENPEPAEAVDRFDDGRAALLVDKGAQSGAISRHERRRDEVGEVEDGEVLVELAEAAGIVYEKSFAARPLEEPGGVEIEDVDGRILADEDRVEGGERSRLSLAESKGIGRDHGGADCCGADDGFLGLGDDLVVLEREVLGLAGEELVTARGRLADESQAGVAVEVEAGEGIDEEEETHASADRSLAGQEVLEAVFAHSIIERRAVDAECSRGAGDVVVALLDGGDDLAFFLVEKALGERPRFVGARSAEGRDGRRASGVA